MRIAVVGAGALGSLYAGMLARAGTDVTLLGRSPAHIDMIRAEGLRMTVQEKADWTVRLAATGDAHTIGRVDTVLFLTNIPEVKKAACGVRKSNVQGQIVAVRVDYRVCHQNKQ